MPNYVLQKYIRHLGAGFEQLKGRLGTKQKAKKKKKNQTANQ